MRRFMFLVFLSIILMSCMSTKGYVKDPTRLANVQRVAVLPFVSNDTATGTTIAESLAAELLVSRFTIVERSQLERLLAERHLTIEGIVNGRESFVGKIEGVDAFILGSVTSSRGFAGLAYGGTIDYVSACTTRIVDVKTGEVLYAVNYKSDAPNTWSGVSTPGKVAEKLAAELSRL